MADSTRNEARGEMLNGITMHPAPAPVKLHPKVIKAIAIEASLDVDWEAMHEDRPEILIATYERIGNDIDYIRLLLSGELTETWAVLRCMEQLSQECDRIAETLGTELLRLDRFGKKKGRRREVETTVKQQRKQAKRARKAWRDCRRFWEQTMEHDKDQEAAARLSIEEVRV